MNKLKNISNGYENISVEVIDYANKIAEHAWNCYRMTWKHLQNVEYDTSNPDVIECLDNIINFRALPMPREQALITFRINNISRVCLAQLTRQRKSAFNVESQMPRSIEHNVIVPLNISKKYGERATKLIEESQSFYDDLLKDGVPAQDARYMTMHGQTTSLVYVVDINTFVGSFGFRCENNLSDEINLVYRLCKQAIMKQLQFDVSVKLIDTLTYRFYTLILSGADAAGAKQQVGQNYDRVFGNSFARFPDLNGEITDITKNCTYDYRNSAWYLELIELYRKRPELLFKGEREMIEKWLV